MGLQGGAASREGAKCGPCAWYLGRRRAHAYLQRVMVRVKVTSRVKVMGMPGSCWDECRARARGRGREWHRAPRVLWAAWEWLGLSVSWEDGQVSSWSQA